MKTPTEEVHYLGQMLSATTADDTPRLIAISKRIAEVADSQQRVNESVLADKLADAVTELRQLLAAHGLGGQVGKDALSAWEEDRKHYAEMETLKEENTRSDAPQGRVE